MIIILFLTLIYYRKIIFAKNVIIKKSGQMKKAIILLFLVTICLGLNAQLDFKNDISVSYGIITTDQVIDIESDILESIVTLGSYSTENTKYIGAIFLTYKYNVTKGLMLGAAVGTDRITEDVISDKNKSGELVKNNITIAFEGDYRYLAKEIFQMYSGIGVGYTFVNEKYTPISGDESTGSSNHFNFQANLLGLRVGKSFGAFIELGIGYKGVFNFGLSGQF